MADVTDADREKVMRAVGYHPSWTYGDLGAEFSLGQQSMVDRIAAALAEEREKARAPFARLADEIQAAAGDRQDVVSATMRDDAALIRATLDDNR